MDNKPLQCPYCGSIENHGNVCDWCHNQISHDYESEDKKMNVEIKFTDLTPEIALALMAQAAQLSPAAAPTQNAVPVQPAPIALTPVAPAPIAPVPVAPIMPAPAAPVMSAPVIPAPAVPVQPAPVVPLAGAPTYDIEALGRAAAPLAAQGRQAELKALISSFGVQSLTQLPKERYGEMATALRGLGAQI